MKKILTLVFIILHSSFIISNAQSTTILPNLLSVPNVAANGTCDVAAKGSTVFNTTDNKMYYCNGTSWLEMGGSGFTLPYSASQNIVSPNALLSLSGTGTGTTIFGESTTSGIGVMGKSNTGIGVSGESNSNIGIYGKTTSGYGGYFTSGVSGIALGVFGKLQLASSTGVTGSIATVNATGNPIWQDPIAFSVNDLGASNISITNNIDTKVPFTGEEFDLGSDYNLTTNEFTAPVKGVYHFDAFALWISHTNGTGYVAITFKVNNTLHSTIRNPAISGKEISNNLSIDIALNANDKVSLFAFQNSGVAQTLAQDGRLVKFSGHLVYLR